MSTRSESGDGMRLRMKVWTDPSTDTRYLVSVAFLRDVFEGRPVSDFMCAYAMSDADTKLITLRAHEYNALPYFYFKEEGPAPRPSPRDFDVIYNNTSREKET